MISDEEKEQVRAATDFAALVSETVELRPRGRDLWGCCPFHHEKSPSFHINPQTGLWKCFGCGLGGDMFAYVMQRESLDFPDAIRYLADKAGIELHEERMRSQKGPKRNRLLDCLAAAETFYQNQLLRVRGEANDQARHYLSGRGFNSEVCKKWKLGFAPGRGSLQAELSRQGFTVSEMVAANLIYTGRSGRDVFFNRVMFPIHDEQGRCIGFGGRVMEKAEPKYLNTSETRVFHKGKQLFAFDRAKEQMVAEGVAIVCEGYTDVISMHEAGITNAVATLGTALTIDHLRQLERFAKNRVVCMFDGDAAGQKAAERSIQFIGQTTLDMACVVLPGGKDPAEFLADHSADELRAIIANARSLMDFVFNKRLASYDLSSPGKRLEALKDMAKLLTPLRSSHLLDGYALQISELLGFDKESVIAEVKQAKAPEEFRDSSKSAYAVNFTTEVYRPEPDESHYTDYVPYEEFVPVKPTSSPVNLAKEEVAQLQAERELLSFMAANMEQIRPFGPRITSLVWADQNHEAMAWAMLATPAGASPREVVQSAESAYAGAASILASGTLERTSKLSLDKQAEYLVNVVDLWSKTNEIKRIKAKLSAHQYLPSEIEEQFSLATKLQNEANILKNAVTSVTGR